jgi:histidinol-phosphatase (PHP family)
MTEPMPALDMVARYVAMGGQAVTIGSDAHQADAVGGKFDVVVPRLRDAGVKYLDVFENRQRKLIPLNNL